MSCERVFLDWRRGFMARAASWLLESEGGERFVLERSIVVVPGRRAGRLLESCLLAAAAAEGRSALLLPSVLTPGDLGRRLLATSEPPASELERRLCWADALAVAGVRPSVAGLAAGGPWMQRLALAELLCRLQDELAAGGWSLAAAAEVAGRQLEFFEEARWQRLQEAEQECRSRLAALGRSDPAAVLVDADAPVVTMPPGAGLVLVGIAELAPALRRLLETAVPHAVALVQAPPEMAASFDGWGAIDAEAWAREPIALGSVEVRVVDGPGEQIACAREALAGAPGRVTVGVGAERLWPGLVAALRRDGIAIHAPQAQPLRATAPGQLLRCLSRYLERRRLSDLGALLRLPEVENWCRRTLATQAPVGRAGTTPSDLLDLCDRFASDRLQRSLEGSWPAGSDDGALLQAVDGALLQLVAGPQGLLDEARPLSHWSRRVGGLLAAFYGAGEDELGDETWAALERIAGHLEEHTVLEGSAVDASLTAADALEALVAVLGREALPVGADSAEVELLGWLELATDDAARTIVLGCNEGSIPESARRDPFLPDHLRGLLGLADDRGRFARDRFLLRTLVARGSLTLVSARFDADEEPLVPSRLLLAGAEETLAPTILDFFVRRGESPEPRRLPVGDSLRFRLPPPDEAWPLPRQLSVTAFRDYLRCPYRFYLRHVLGLRWRDDTAAELTPAQFGSLAHETLGSLGRYDPASVGSASELTARLHEDLDHAVRRRFGAAPPVAARLQIEQLRRRLGQIASWHSRQGAAGWAIDPAWCERRLLATLEVDGEPIEIRGRLDRLDRHADGGVRLLDYKTADRAKTPEQVHEIPGEGWIDLQLPLYRWLVLENGLAADGPLELGFLRLSADLGADPLALAGWSRSELEAALDAARDVVRALRERRFWPPEEPPPFDDGLRLVAGDDLAKRDLLIAAGEA